ncbi:MAG: biotin/acetyl-CoA-carboxylase ligase [Acidimicrobiales bacterium]|nr:biotin/acetyl-CoA-carboxylase ligase [Acidimicrobiales bacterium]
MSDVHPGARARDALSGTLFSAVRWVHETGSTNADLMELARHGEAEGVVVVADHQTAGRGRRGRTWEAPPGASLMASVLLRPRSAEAGATTMAVAVAAAEAVEELTGCVARLKWPNDLVWPGDGSEADRKLAGILAEVDWPAASTASSGWSAPGPDDRVAVVVGIGINVAWGPMPPDLAPIAVALDHITAPAPPPDREDLLIAFLTALDRTYRHLTSGPRGRDRLRDRWRERSATLGRRVRVDLGSDDVEGTAVDVTDDGHLVVETIQGDRRVLAVGDVVHLRNERHPS